MELRKLCWVPNLDALEEAIVLEEWESYYIDYYTSHYFDCANQIIEAYWKDIDRFTLNSDCGKIIVFKGDRNVQGHLVERAITPIYTRHIKNLEQLLSQLYYFKMLERIDYYNYCKQGDGRYDRIFPLNEYRDLQMISSLQDSVQKQNFDFIRYTIYQRMFKRENYYEIIRILLSMSPNTWRHDIDLPPLKNYVSYTKVEEVEMIANQKKLVNDIGKSI